MKNQCTMILVSLFLATNSALAEPFKPMKVSIAEESKARYKVIGKKDNPDGIIYNRDRAPTLKKNRIEKISLKDKYYYQIEDTLILSNKQIQEVS